MASKCFHSCFVIDVKVSETVAELTDSTKRTWNVDLSNSELTRQFKIWLKFVFCKGIAQTLTVFEYKDLGSEMDFDMWIQKFCNLPDAT